METPFVIRCISEQCTLVFADKTYTLSAIDDEIAKGANVPGSFGYKLKIAKDEVANL